jgi:hypothetical protein
MTEIQDSERASPRKGYHQPHIGRLEGGDADDKRDHWIAHHEHVAKGYWQPQVWSDLQHGA